MGKNDAAFQKLAAAHLAGPARFISASSQQAPTRAAVKQHVAASSANTAKFHALVKEHLKGGGGDEPRDDHGRWTGK